ncbi:recombinase RecQ [Priestia veravalensis]|uniref:Recombinase RecQ n=1 Tax=Priestia veravalensis TaxID=1414648 RepID=A0A0V8JR10_9BACI|nr:recombinase RecQ [Priestia veravalensis]
MKRERKLTIVNYIQTVMLYSMQQLKGERTVYGIYHIVTGKKSAQTIQDGKIFGLSFLFQSFSYLKKETFSLYVKELTSHQFIKEVDHQKYMLTSKGEEALHQQLREWPLPAKLSGWQFASSTQLFLSRLTLFIQTISNLQYFQKGFLPITQDPEIIQWVKAYLFSQSYSREELAKRLFNELKCILTKCSSQNADVFVQHLSGYKRIGLTKSQLAEYYKMNEHYVHLLMISVVHQIIEQISECRSEFPVLQQFIQDVHMTVPLTASTVKTYEWLQKGKSLKEVARIRRLKESTIEDHIAELALFLPNFTIDDYVKVEDQKEIMNAFEALNTNQLKEIKKRVSDHLTYFQIRLVLAKCVTN